MNDDLRSSAERGCEQESSYASSSHYSYSDYQESLKKTPPKLPNSNNETQIKGIERKGSYPQGMDNNEQICIDIGSGATKAEEITESTDKMGKDAPIDLVEQFKALSQEEQERAISYIAEFKEKAALNTEYIPPELPEKNDGSYQTLAPYVRLDDNELIDFVNENWGDYLASHNPNLDTDIISRKQLRRYDKRLMTRLDKLHPDKLNKIIQTESTKIGIKIKHSPPTKEEIKKAANIQKYISRHNIEIIPA